MRRYPQFAVGAVAVAVISVNGCSPDSGSDQTSPSPDSPASSPPGATTEQVAPAPPPPGEVAISPGGVTTAVGAPAESTEDDYFQACMAARTWMEQRGDDLRAQIEPYLAMVQSTQSAGPATFGAPWSELSAGQQSAVIVAVEAAADRMCG